MTSIELADIDRDYLIKCADLFETDKPIETTLHYDKAREVYHRGARLVINSKKIVTDLGKFGILQNKSLTMDPLLDRFTYLEQIPIWQGCVDADGSLFLRENKYPTLELCGSKKTVEKFDECVEILTGVKAKIEAHKTIFRVRYQKTEEAVLIADLLYSKSRFFLTRKKSIATIWNFQYK